MNSLLVNICAKAAVVIGLMMLLPAMCDLYIGSKDYIIFACSSALTLMVASLLLCATTGQKWHFSTRFGFLLSVCLWFLSIFLGALPFYFADLHLSFAESIFECTSTITASGGTVLRCLDKLPHGILLWRSLLCWLGGLGVMALTLLLLPSLRNDGVQFFNMESAYKSEKLLPRVNQVISGIVFIYLILTFCCTMAYFIGGMSLFDAVNHAMTTMATSGVSTHDASFGYFHSHILLILGGIFMILGSFPITFYLKILTIGLRKSLADLQVLVFLSIIAVCVVILTYYLHWHQHMSYNEAFYQAYFHFISLISTSGYIVQDYSNWGSFAVGILVIATIIGGCSGSTSGGIKINRIIMLWQITRAYMSQLIYPNIVLKIRYGDTEITDQVAQSVLLFICLFLITILLSMMLLMCCGLDLVSAFSGTIGCICNMGLGLGDKIGPSGNYSCLSSTVLWIFSFIMLAGRLELITLYVIFSASFWRK